MTTVRVPNRRPLWQIALAFLGIAALVVVLLYGVYRAGLLPVRVVGLSSFRPTATLLPDGDVIIISDSKIIERYNPARDRWQRVGKVPQELSYHTATLLADGRILVIGGIVSGDARRDTAFSQVYDPTTGHWTPTPELAINSYGVLATLLRDGTALVIGEGRYAGDEPVATRYEPAGNRWLPAAKLPAKYSADTATLLTDGRVLVLNGTSAKLYDPAGDRWQDAANPQMRRFGFTATLLNDGDVLVAGGRDAMTEVYQPATDSWRSAGSLATARTYATATLLADGRVLIVGGESEDIFAKDDRLDSVERYDPPTDRWSTTGHLAQSRYWHASILLRDGEVLVVDGTGVGRVASAERYTPGDGRWRNASGLSLTAIAVYMGMWTLFFGCYVLAGFGAAMYSETRFGGWWFQQIERRRFQLPLSARTKRALALVQGQLFLQWLLPTTFMLHETSLWPFSGDLPWLLLFGPALLMIPLVIAIRRHRDVLRPAAPKRPATS